MTSFLVTGGSGGLGRPTVDLLCVAEGTGEVRVLSRKTGPWRGDLATGAGLDAALGGVDTVLHLATGGRRDPAMTGTLLRAAGRAQVRHLVYISIVGVDAIPFGYYREKYACEQAIAASGLPWTILRATQFHSLVARIVGAPLPVRLALPIPVQPIATGEVAARLAELAQGAPAGRVADMGGPEQLTMRRAAEIWNAAHGSRRPVLTLPLGGKTIRALKAGAHMPGLPGAGTGTFADYAAAHAAVTRP